MMQSINSMHDNSKTEILQNNHKLKEENNNLKNNISNLQYELLDVKIDLSDFKNNVYLVNIYSNEVLVQTTRFVVRH